MLRVVLTAALALSSLAGAVDRQRPPIPADIWPQWRGPGGRAVGQAATYPDSWSNTENVAWKTAIPGRGHSSPIVWGDWIFLTTSIEGGPAPAGHKAPVHLGFDMKPGYVNPDSVAPDKEYSLHVLAVSASTGKILWQHEVFNGPMYDARHRKNTYASSSAATDGALVYFFFEAGGLFAYDVNGTLKWKRSLGSIAKAGMGPGTSPIIFENLLIVQVDQGMGEAGSFIAAFDRFTGEPVWKSERHNRRSWATPLMVTTGDEIELIASGAEAVIAYDPKTGRERWRTDGTKGHPIPSSAAGHGLVFAFAGNAENSKMVIAFKPGQQPSDATSRVKWKYTRGTAYVASPILYGDFLYLLTDNGITTCLEAATGAVQYLGGRPPVPATFTASPVAFADKILFTSEDGDTFVLRAGPKHEIIRTNSIGEPVYASIALANGRVYIRGDKHLYAIK